MKDTLHISVLRGPQFYQFSDCFLDTVERRLFKKNKRINITPKAFEVLQVLVENAGDVVSKDDLLEQIWGDRFVEEGNLAVQISKLRRALAASKDEPYIVTDSGTGYQFVSRLRIVDDDEWVDLTENQLAERKNGKQKYTSIAIMPLLNENGDEEVEYLADGITENLINTLSYAQDLRVIARNTVFQFKEKEIDVKKLGRKLRVSTILTGRIRVVKDSLVVAVELTKVADGTQIWGTHLTEDFDDIFEIQAKITESLSQELMSKIERHDEMNSNEVNEHPEAYRSFLKGQYLLNKRTIVQTTQAIEAFNLSIGLDPLFIPSYIELSYAYIFQSLYGLSNISLVRDKIDFSLLKIKEVSRPNSDFFTVRAYRKMVLDIDLDSAESDFKKAIQLNPRNLRVHYHYSNLLAYRSDSLKTLDHVNEISRLDPFSMSSNKHIARVLYLLGHYDAGLTRLNECLEIEPDDFETHLLIGSILVELDRFEESQKAFNRSYTLQQHPETLAMIGYSHGKSNEKKKATKVLNRLEEAAQKMPFTPLYIGYVLASIGEYERALGFLKSAFLRRDSNLIALKVDPRWARLRDNKSLIRIITQLRL